MKRKLLFIVLMLTAGFAFANGQPVSQTCRYEKGTLLTNKTVLNFNVTREGYVNYRLSGEGDVWYFLHAENSSIQGINFEYDFLKVAYLTGARIDVCLYPDGNTLELGRTNDANN